MSGKFVKLSEKASYYLIDFKSKKRTIIITNSEEDDADFDDYGYNRSNHRYDELYDENEANRKEFKQVLIPEHSFLITLYNNRIDNLAIGTRNDNLMTGLKLNGYRLTICGEFLDREISSHEDVLKLVSDYWQTTFPYYYNGNPLKPETMDYTQYLQRFLADNQQ